MSHAPRSRHSHSAFRCRFRYASIGWPVGCDGGGNTPGKNPKGPGTATPKVDAKDFKARADSEVNAGTPMPGVNMGRTRARAGETANTQGTGALGAVGPDEVNGVSRSDVPEEYREQVGRYFQP